MSISAAADGAGMRRNTWSGVEKGTRDTAELTYSRVERTLGWQPGSIETIITGGQPATDPAFTRDDPGDEWLARLEEIRDNPHRSQHLRDEAAQQIERLRTLLEAAAAEDNARQTGS